MTNLAAKFVRGNMYDNAGGKTGQSVRAVTMDRLATWMDALRVLAKSTDPGRAVLIEKYIDAYLHR
jgi:hypothetical protein